MIQSRIDSSPGLIDICVLARVLLADIIPLLNDSGTLTRSSR
jgi:hypothetical protein